MRLRIFVAVFLSDKQGRLMVMKRADWKKFAPNKVTGIGGQLKINEHRNVIKGLKREFEEETGMKFKDVKDLQLRGTIYVVNREPDSDYLIYFYLGGITTDKIRSLDCNEGELIWCRKKDLDKLDWVRTIKICYKYLLDKKVKRFTCLLDETDMSYKVKLTER